MKDKFGSNNGKMFFAGIDTTVLAKDYKTPLYVFDQAKIESVCRAFTDALSTYGNGMISYASKAFSCKEIYKIVGNMGLGADVVSGGELYTAIKSGFNLEKIIFHGNNKSEDEIELAVKNSVGYIVIDSYEEIDVIDDFAKKYNVIQNVLIRVNPGIEAHTHHYIQTAKIDSKFGFSLIDGETENVIEKVIEKKNLRLKGLHAHIGSQIFELKSFLLETEILLNFYKKIKTEKNIEFTSLNLGGGFGITYNSFDPEINEDFYYNTVKSICDTVSKTTEKLGIIKPYLIFEPGRSIVGEAGITLYTVGNVKTIKNLKNYVSIDGGMFENPRFALYQAQYTVLPASKMDEKPSINYTIAGKCCESGDIIAENQILPKLEKGDVLAVLSTGAYNYSMASNYNRNLIPAVVMIKDKKVREIVRRQNLDDIISFDL